MFAVAVLLMGTTGCSKDDNPSTPDTSALEKSLVGLWWDEFEYADVTEAGEPFSHALLALKVDADHTGCIYLGVFNDESDEPLAVYGGPEDAGFTWRLQDDGTIVLGDPVTGETYALARTRAGEGKSFIESINDMWSKRVTYTDGSVELTDGSFTFTLKKADAEKMAEIIKQMNTPQKPVQPVGPLSTADTSNIGQVVCSDGKLYPAKTAVPSGCTAVGILGKVTETGHGLILSLQDAHEQYWNNILWWTSVTTYAGTTLKLLPNDAACGSLTSYTKLGETTVSNWCVAQKSDYDAIFQNLGSMMGNNNSKVYDSNVNAYITSGVGGTALYGRYWSATEADDYIWSFGDDYWFRNYNYHNFNVRPVLGF